MATKIKQSPNTVVHQHVNLAIDEIRKHFKGDITFDSHLVIEWIFKNESGDWLRFLDDSPTVNKMHSDIAKMIKKNPAVEMLPGKHISFSVFGRIGQNALWRFRQPDASADGEAATEK